MGGAGASAFAPESGFPVECACASDIGGREEQQDRVAVFRSENAVLLALADGLGGHEDGAAAAGAVIDAAQQAFSAVGAAAGDTHPGATEDTHPAAEDTHPGATEDTHPATEDAAEDTHPATEDTQPATEDTHPKQLLERVVLAANEQIRMQAWTKASSGARQSGSTCVLLHLTAAKATWAHIGDSRLYFFTNGKLTGRSLDHSLVEILRLKGRISEQEMKSHPDRNRLLEALGMSFEPEPEIDQKPASPADGFLLCSDGLWEHLADSELEQAMAADELQTGLDKLVSEARARGGKNGDNISVAAARFRETLQ